MKLITWNCQMAFRKKADYILQFKPDILVVQECEHTSKVDSAFKSNKPNSSVWIGDNENKGLGIFSFGDYKLKLHRSHNENLKLIAPVKVSNGDLQYLLYAIWAHNPQDPDGQYVTQVWKALKHYNKQIKSKNTILAGDFNSNTIWDKPRREGNHSTVVKILGRRKIRSVYHQHYIQEQGRELHPTFYLYKNKKKPYHIDYCFASNDWMEKLVSVEVGSFEAWKKHSDHVPLMVTFS